MKTCKGETTHILEDAKFTVHKSESNVKDLEDQDMPNPSKILGQVWHKEDDTLEIKIPQFSKDTPVVWGKCFNPLGILSPTTAAGKHIYREACDKKLGWNTVVSGRLAMACLKWIAQLRSVKVPRSFVRQCNEVNSLSPPFCPRKQPGLFRSNNSHCQARYWHSTRTSDLEVKNLKKEYCDAQTRTGDTCSKHGQKCSTSSITIWMDNTVALYWLTSPGRNWKVFTANQVWKIAKITEELNISWKYCLTEKNIADLGSRGRSLDKMEKSNCLTGPEWLQYEDEWPEQPILARSIWVSEGEKPLREV